MAISGGGGNCVAPAGEAGGSGGGSGSASGCGNGNGRNGRGTISGNPNENILCGMKLKVRLERGEGLATGVIVRVVDRCTSCGPTDLGLSPGAFKTLGDEQALQEGRAKGVWEWA